ncbi:hypothetical protein [Hyphomicrobium sp.]|jgi:hypothetical protein|uniref:hypothetical protein n=1 Tax=Hyphomicrobium sp. TaxID=82 RepID=UPI003569AAA3
MIAAVSCATCTAPRVGSKDVSGKAKEAALQQKIDAKSMQQARTTCDETAGKIGADIASLKSQLAQLQMTDKSAEGSATDVSSTAPDARYQEF